MMQAAWYERNGAAKDVIEVGEMETPAVGSGEVRVRVHVSGVNPSDIKRRSGGVWGAMAFPKIIPHSDGAGVIDAIGEGVAPSRLGERVWIYNAQWHRPCGTAAEYVVLPSAQAVPLPDKTEFAEGACLGIPAMTAHRCVFSDGAVSNQIVLVTGGAGAVGHYAIQFAKWGGATVITTVSSPEKAEHARAAGADYVLNYKIEDVADHIRKITGREGVNRIIEVEFGGNLTFDLGVLKPNGAIATYGSMAEHEPQLPFYRLLTNGVTIHFVYVYILPVAALQSAIADITTCLRTGVLRHAIARRFPLTEVGAAHEAVENGQMLGKVVVEVI